MEPQVRFEWEDERRIFVWEPRLALDLWSSIARQLLHCMHPFQPQSNPVVYPYLPDQAPKNSTANARARGGREYTPQPRSRLQRAFARRRRPWVRCFSC